MRFCYLFNVVKLDLKQWPHLEFRLNPWTYFPQVSGQLLFLCGLGFVDNSISVSSSVYFHTN